MPSASPTQLTLRYLREQGFLAQVVERWVPTRDPEEEGRRSGMMEAVKFLRETAQRYGDGVSGVISLALREAADSIERSLPAEFQGSPGRRVDLFGLIDVLCLDGKPGCLGAQCCAYSGVSAHVKEMKEGTVKVPTLPMGALVELKRDLALRWLSAGNRLSIFGWHKKDGRWTPRIVEITAETLRG